MTRKLLPLILVAGLSACATSDPNVISEYKPQVPKDRKEVRDGFVGKWESTQPTKSGGTRHSLIERNYDSRYVVEFTLLDETGSVKSTQKEFGYWGVAGGIYFTMFRGWINNDELEHADPDNPYNYDSYKVVEVTKDKLVYQSLSSGNLFTYSRVLN